jgi:peptidoglycan hydrolase CwlO-like protein
MKIGQKTEEQSYQLKNKVMRSLLLILAMSPALAAVLIVGLLLVAGVIGYLTAWFYAKSVYTPVIKKLEDEKAQLSHEISGLKSDIDKLEGKIKEFGKKVDELEKEVAEREKEVSEKVTMINQIEAELKDLRQKSKV